MSVDFHTTTSISLPGNADIPDSWLAEQWHTCSAGRGLTDVAVSRSHCLSVMRRQHILMMLAIALSPLPPDTRTNKHSFRDDTHRVLGEMLADGLALLQVAVLQMIVRHAHCSNMASATPTGPLLASNPPPQIISLTAKGETVRRAADATPNDTQLIDITCVCARVSWRAAVIDSGVHVSDAGRGRVSFFQCRSHGTKVPSCPLFVPSKPTLPYQPDGAGKYMSSNVNI